VVEPIPPEGKKITLSWSPISVPSGEELAGYKIYYGPASDKHKEQVDAGESDSTITIENLINNQTYYFSIVAEYASGAVSGYSNEVSATPKDTEGPAIPSAITAAPGDGKVTVSWTSDAETTSFRVYYKATTETCNDSVNFGDSQAASKSPVVISNLTNGTRYCFGVVAYDAENNESEKAISSAIPFTAPTNLSAVAGIGQVDLTWSSAAGADSYNIYYRPDSDENYGTPVKVAGTETSYPVAGLENDKTYYFAIKSVNIDTSESGYSNVIIVKTKAP